jgi:glycosyltransferase involved in cell wall biosynthesis
LQRGGAERVVLAMSDAFPDAPIYTSFYSPRSTFPEFGDRDVRSQLRLSGDLGPRIQKLVFPLMRSVIGGMAPSEDVVLCSTSGWAHAVPHRGRKVVYCHNPPRWLHQQDDYFRGALRHMRKPTAAYRRRLRAWDQSAGRSADVYIANSTVVQARVAKVYSRQAEVLFPPPGLGSAGEMEPVEGVSESYCLAVGRLQPYKHIRFVAETFARLLPGLQLVVVGDGPEASLVDSVGGAGIRRIEHASDAQLRWLYSHAQLLVGASFEDFGLTPVEAALHGTPSVALDYGGYRDTILPYSTGLLFNRLVPGELASAVQAALAQGWDRTAIASRAEKEFGSERFRTRLTEVISSVG